jgi:hypothetical protein
MSNNTKKKTIKINKQINKFWHEDSSLVFKSKDEKVVIGRFDGEEFIEMDDETVALADEWKFKLDPSMIEEEVFSSDEQNFNQEEEREEEEVNEVVHPVIHDVVDELVPPVVNDVVEEVVPSVVHDVVDEVVPPVVPPVVPSVVPPVVPSVVPPVSTLVVPDVVHEVNSVINRDKNKAEEEEKFDKLINTVTEMYKEMLNSNKDEKDRNTFLTERISNLENELADMTDKYKKINNKFICLKELIM